MPRVACPACSSRRSSLVRSIRNRDSTTERLFPVISVSICRRCGLIFQNPRVSRPRLERLYARLADKTNDGDLTSVTEAQARSRLKALTGLRPPPARLLEIGCSDGSFLASARAQSYEVVGIDPSRVNLDQARKRHPGLDLRLGFIENLQVAGRFDVICHFYVLEYSFDPKRFLSRVRRLLKPEGVMLFEVPDAEKFPELPFANTLFTYQDIMVFSPGTLKNLLSASGFRLLRDFGPASKSYGLRGAASPGAPRTRVRCYSKESLRLLRSYFGKQDALLRRIEGRVDKWLASLRGRQGPVVIFGAGENGRILTATSLREKAKTLLLSDNNASLHGGSVDGVPVVSPERLPALGPALVVVASVEYQDDMTRQLLRLGIDAARIVKLYEDF